MKMERLIAMDFGGLVEQSPAKIRRLARGDAPKMEWNRPPFASLHRAQEKELRPFVVLIPHRKIVFEIP